MHSGLVRLLGASPGLLRLIAAYCRNKPWRVRLLGASPGSSGLLRLIAAISGLLRLIAAISLGASPGSSGLLRPIAFRQETFRQGKVSRRRQRGFQRLRHCGRRAAAVCKEELPRGLLRLIAARCGSLRLIAARCGSLRCIADGTRRASDCGLLRLVAAYCGLLRLIAACYVACTRGAAALCTSAAVFCTYVHSTAYGYVRKYVHMHPYIYIYIYI